MIHTIYSNSYEVLRAVLLSNMTELRFRGCPGDVGVDELAASNPAALMARAFERIPVIVPSAAVADDLRRAIAQKESVCAAVDFMQLSHWMGFFSKEPLANVVGSEAEWLIWCILRETGEGSFRESIRAEAPSCRLLNYLDGKTDRDLYALASRIAAVFVTYATYRVDWLFDWLDLHRALLPKGPEASAERAKLEKHPDYLWQRRLWERLSEMPGWLGKRFLGELPESLEKLASAPLSLKAMPVGRRREAPLPGALHVFAPFVVPPLMLPILKAYAHSGRDIWLYLLNPSSEYWFDLVPQRLFDWRSSDGEHREVGHPILADNGRSVRANIDRLWRFTAAPEDERDDAGRVPIAELDLEALPWRAEPAHREVEAAADLSESAMDARAKAFLGGLRRLEAQAPLDTHGYYLETRGSSLLNRVQDSILTLNPHLDETADGAELFRPDDGSIAFLAAPTPTRELEGLADWLHAQFAADPTLKPHDVLVATPDISASAPLIEKVFGSLSSEREIAFRIKGGRPIDADVPSQALLALAKLLTTRSTIDDFMAWLARAPVAKGFGLTIDDLEIIGRWLTAAGFRYGLSDAHLQGLDAETFASVRDMTLERAIERLTLGALLPDAREAPVGDAAPVRGSESGEWTTVSERMDLLEKLARIAARLEALRLSLEADAQALERRGPVVWTEWISKALETVFARESAENDYRTLREAASAVRTEIETAVRARMPAAEASDGADAEAAVAELGEDDYRSAPVGFSLFMTALESRLSTSSSAGTPTNAVTFTSMAALRGLPYKVIVILGLSQDCRFPGTTRLEEFDLMGAAPRAGDRDSRVDNRNVFLDLLLAARRKFLITYVCGTDEKNPLGPSVVADELRAWLLSFAHGKAEKARAAQLLTTTLSLNAFSMENFDPKRGVWQSRDAELLRAVQAQLDAWTGAGDRAKDRAEAVFADCGAGELARTAGRLPADGTVQLAELLRFWREPSEWLLRQADVRFPQWREPVAGLDSVVPVMSGLSNWAIRQKALDILEETADLDDYLAMLSVDPRNGIRGIRETLVEAPLELARALDAARKEAAAGLSHVPPVRVSVKLQAREMLDGRPLVIEDEVRDLYAGVDDDGSAVVQLIAATPSGPHRLWRTLLVFAAAAASQKRLPLSGGKFICLAKSGDEKVLVVDIPPIEPKAARTFLALFASLWRACYANPAAFADGGAVAGKAMTRADFADFEVFRGRSQRGAAARREALEAVLADMVVKTPFAAALQKLDALVRQAIDASRFERAVLTNAPKSGDKA